MSLRVVLRPEVEDDIIELARYIAQDSRDAAVRFLEACEETIAGLVRFPGKGSLCRTDLLQEHQIRFWAIKGFPNHLVFYIAPSGSDRIRVLAVLHGARDIEAVLSRRLGSA